VPWAEPVEILRQDALQFLQAIITGIDIIPNPSQHLACITRLDQWLESILVLDSHRLRHKADIVSDLKRILVLQGSETLLATHANGSQNVGTGSFSLFQRGPA
jgi:hypothetical protein